MCDIYVYILMVYVGIVHYSNVISSGICAVIHSADGIEYLCASPPEPAPSQMDLELVCHESNCNDKNKEPLFWGGSC